MTRLHRPEIHIVAGCVVAGHADGVQIVRRVGLGEAPAFWGHYEIESDGRQMWVGDHEICDEAVVAARARAGRHPVFLGEGGALRLLQRRSTRPQPRTSSR